MAPISNPRVLFSKIPHGYPEPGKNLVYDTSERLDPENVLINGGFITRTILVSPEPWLRDRLRDPTKTSYTTPMRLEYPIVGFGLIKVLRSEDPKYIAGDYLIGLIRLRTITITAWQLYIIHPWDNAKPPPPGQWPDYTADLDNHPLFALQKVEKNPYIPWSTFLGALGGPGQTAYVGLREFAPDMKSGQVIYVSAAAGAVGLMAVQLAKVAGLKVIASAGSDEKVNYLLNDIGVDVVFNYKTTSVDSVLAKEGPIDIYFDNVGGKTLEAAIDHCKAHGKILACGYISEYNHEEKYGIGSLHWLFKKRLQIYGLFTPDYLPKWFNKFLEEVPALIVQGKIKTKEDLVYGLENAPQAFVDLLQGKNLGKTIVVVSEDD